MMVLLIATCNRHQLKTMRLLARIAQPQREALLTMKSTDVFRTAGIVMNIIVIKRLQHKTQRPAV